MDVFLRMKAWHVFVLVVVIPLFAHFLVISLAFEVDDPRSILQYYPFIMIFFAGIFLGWMYSLGVGLNKLTPAEIRPKLIYFKIFQLYLIIFIILSQCFAYYVIAHYPDEVITHYPDRAQIPIPLFVAPMHIFAVFCGFYGFYFVSKNLEMANRRQKVKFYDFAGAFFLLIIFPIGIWFLQPKINQIHDRAAHDT